jgi:uncharacterized membrane protein YkvA (DUF1232 family)
VSSRPVRRRAPGPPARTRSAGAADGAAGGDTIPIVEIAVGIVGGLVAAWILLVVVLWIARPRDVRLGELARVVPDIARLVRDLLADRATPRAVRAALVILLAWLVWPFDLVPEFIPVLGPLDDVVVAVLVLQFVRRRLGDDALRRHWRGTDDGFALLTGVAGGQPR